MSLDPPKDLSLRCLTVNSNFVTSGQATFGGTLTSVSRLQGNVADFFEMTATQSNITEATIETLNNMVLNEATVNNGLQFQTTQQETKLNQHRNFMINNTIAQLTALQPMPTFTAGRIVTFRNMTSATTLDIYVTEGYPNAKAPTIIPGGSAVAPGGAPVMWQIPTTPGWNGNFTAFPTGSQVMSGSTLAEFGFNQLWSGATPPLRETFDISTVPPGIGTRCSNGPRSLCVELSRKNGFTNQQSYGYNVGVRITPPTSMVLSSQTVTCTEADGDCAQSIGYPNDTAFPKQQTIDYVSAQGYSVDFLDPVRSLTS